MSVDTIYTTIPMTEEKQLWSALQKLKSRELIDFEYADGDDGKPMYIVSMSKRKLLDDATMRALQFDDVMLIVTLFNDASAVNKLSPSRRGNNKLVLRQLVERMLIRSVDNAQTLPNDSASLIRLLMSRSSKGSSTNDYTKYECETNPRTGRVRRACPLFMLKKRSDMWWSVDKVLTMLYGPEGSAERIALVDNLAKAYCATGRGAEDLVCSCILREKNPEYQKILQHLPRVKEGQVSCWYEPCWNPALALPDTSLKPCPRYTCSIRYREYEDEIDRLQINGDTSEQGCLRIIDTDSVLVVADEIARKQDEEDPEPLPYVSPPRRAKPVVPVVTKPATVASSSKPPSSSGTLVTPSINADSEHSTPPGSNEAVSEDEHDEIPTPNTSPVMYFTTYVTGTALLMLLASIVVSSMNNATQTGRKRAQEQRYNTGLPKKSRRTA
jgi:hypothetical protein